MPGEERLRVRGQAVAAGCSTSIGFAGGLGLIIYAISGKSLRTTEIEGLLFIAVLLLVLGAASLRGLLACVKPSIAGVTIMNPLRTVRLSWAEIDHFDLGRAGYFPRVGRAHLTDGRIVHIWAIQGVDPTIRKGPDRRATALLDDLNRRLAATRQSQTGVATGADRPGHA